MSGSFVSLQRSGLQIGKRRLLLVCTLSLQGGWGWTARRRPHPGSHRTPHMPLLPRPARPRRRRRKRRGRRKRRRKERVKK